MIASQTSNATSVADRPTSTPVVWPADRFFWSVLPNPAGHTLRHPAPLPTALLPAFADELPLDPAELHAVGVPLPRGRLLVCAARRDDLSLLDPAALSLTPRDIPSRLDAQADPDRINLLVGRFEPVATRRRKQRRLTRIVLLATLCAASITVGLHRRAAHLHREADSTVALAHSRARTALGPTATTADATNPLAALSRERAAARGYANFLSTLTPPADAAIDFAAALATWPTDLGARPQSFRVGPDSITIASIIPRDAAPLLARFRPPEGWRLTEPRVAAANADPARPIRVTLELTRARPTTP